MGGDVYDCEKCGESIHTSCDCGLPSDQSEEIQKLKEQNKIMRGVLGLINKVSIKPIPSADYISFELFTEKARQALKEYAELMGELK